MRTLSIFASWQGRSQTKFRGGGGAFSRNENISKLVCYRRFLVPFERVLGFTKFTFIAMRKAWQTISSNEVIFTHDLKTVW